MRRRSAEKKYSLRKRTEEQRNGASGGDVSIVRRPFLEALRVTQGNPCKRRFIR